MPKLSIREWGFLLLAAALLAGWAYDHSRYSHRLRRTVESEQYFKERLFETFEAQAVRGNETGAVNSREPNKKSVSPTSN
jgi:hypothetical protein